MRFAWFSATHYWPAIAQSVAAQLVGQIARWASWLPLARWLSKLAQTQGQL